MNDKPSFSIFPNTQVLDLAQSYNDASNILDENGGNALPILNLRMHAIELFLKSLVVKAQSIDQGDGVFLVRVERWGNHVLLNILKEADQCHRTQLLTGLKTLERDLDDLQGLFQDSRYIYETGKNLNIGLARRVVDYLAKEVPKLARISRTSEPN